MGISLNRTLRNEILDRVADKFDGGRLQVRSGARPHSAQADATGTLLAEIELPSPAFKSASGASMQLHGVWSTNAIATGTAGWARLKDVDDYFRLDVDINAGELTLDFVNLILGEPVTVQTFTLSI